MLPGLKFVPGKARSYMMWDFKLAELDLHKAIPEHSP